MLRRAQNEMFAFEIDSEIALLAVGTEYTQAHPGNADSEASAAGWQGPGSDPGPPTRILPVTQVEKEPEFQLAKT